MRCQYFGYSQWMGYIVQWGVALVCLVGNIVTAQITEPVWDPVKTVCNIRYAQSTIVGDMLYVDGGQIMDKRNYFRGVDEPYYDSGMTWWQNEHLWELDLSSRFNVSTPQWKAHPKPEDPDQHYSGAVGLLWNIRDGKFYTLGGWLQFIIGPDPGYSLGPPYITQNSSGTFYHIPVPRTFAYDAETGNWTSKVHPELERLSNTGYAQSARNKVGYMLGGHWIAGTSSSIGGSPSALYPTPPKLVYSLSSYNFMTDEFNTSRIPTELGSVRGLEMHCLERVGNEGVLVAFGGRATVEEYWRPMDEILVYNIETSTWMKQKATGTIPTHRTNTCTVLVPAPDLTSYQIYLFSGLTENYVFLLDVFVLSIPAFTWVKIEMKNYPDQYRISSMSCALYEERQFIIIPGYLNVTVSNMTTDQGKSDNHWLKCNEGTKVHVFDTYDWEFKSEFDPDNKESKVPLPIVGLVGGNNTGGATLKQPKAGWDDPALGPIFLKRNELLPDTSSSFNITFPTNLPSGETTGETHNTAKINKVAIIGGVVGAISVVTLICGALLFVWKKQQTSESTPELPGHNSITEIPGHNPITELPSDNPIPHELHTNGLQEIGDTADRPSTET